MPRETVPQLTAEETRKSLRWAAESLQLECIEISELVPTFLLLPAAAPDALLFATWHAEAVPVEPAAVEGAERLALSATLRAEPKWGWWSRREPRKAPWSWDRLSASTGRA